MRYQGWAQTNLHTRHNRLRWQSIVLILIGLSVGRPELSEAAGPYRLDDDASDSRVVQTTGTIKVTGKLQTLVGKNQAIPLTLDVDAGVKFRERRLPPAGRDAAALRSLRYYDEARADVKVNQQTTLTRLQSSQRLIIADGHRDGIQFYRPNAAMTANEIDLLKTPADNLAVVGLLPRSTVEVGQTWQPDGWVIQMLCGIEAVAKSELECKLEAATSRDATVSFSGHIEGAIYGAATTVDVRGQFVYDMQDKLIRQVNFEQTEKRSIGSVSPGMDVTATVELTRKPTNDIGELHEGTVAQIPLEPRPEWTLLQFGSAWDVDFLYDRNWHVFHRTPDVAVLRLVDIGSLTAQCNVSIVPSVAAGTHTSPETFQADIRTALAEKLKSIAEANEIETKDGHWLYRVVAVGESDGVPMYWHYYLLAGPSGQQVAFVFAFEAKLRERLADRDLEMVHSVEFRNRTIPIRQ